MGIFSYHGVKCDCCPKESVYGSGGKVDKGFVPNIEKIKPITLGEKISQNISLDSIISGGEFVIPTKLYEKIKLDNCK